MMPATKNEEVEISGKLKILKEIEIIVPNVEKRERIDKFLTNQIENSTVKNFPIVKDNTMKNSIY